MPTFKKKPVSLISNFWGSLVLYIDYICLKSLSIFIIYLNMFSLNMIMGSSRYMKWSSYVEQQTGHIHLVSPLLA